MESTPYEFNLSSILKYSKKGDFQETASIVIDPPSYENFQHCITIAQAVADEGKIGEQAGRERAQRLQVCLFFG